MGVGLLGVLFALYLTFGGLHAGQIGFLITAGLAGCVAGTFLVSFWADRLGRKRTLLILCLCSFLGGLGLVLRPGLWGLAAACFIGMVNAFGRERGALYTLEQAVLSGAVDDAERTHALAWYNIILEAGLIIGSLLGGMPVFFQERIGSSEIGSYQTTFLFYAFLSLVPLLFYAALSARVELHGPMPWRQVSPKARRIITRISLLFGLDSLGGGFLPGTLLAYWFFKRFGAGEKELALLFAAAHLANGLSYIAAAWLSKRIGLVRTMVFTHLPSHLCLLALPLTPTLAAAMAIYLIRECLVEMDLPTRQSYVMAVVEPSERTLAAGITNLTRLSAWAVSPSLAGFAIKLFGVSFPLYLGGGVKIIYDLALFKSFRHIKPPEER
ncbi:MAG: MFS transporter [Candidatus Omnitrophica bacterium]|nr:MFS transporter [Candidatus Omnitrophota bacterium]